MAAKAWLLHFLYGASTERLFEDLAQMTETRVKAEIMNKIRAVGDARLEEYYGADVDKSSCQPPFFSPDEIEAIIYGLPMPKRV